MTLIHSFHNVWYLSSTNTWQSSRKMAMDDIGILRLDTDGIMFESNTIKLFITDLLSISYGRQGRDFINKWVKINYQKNGEQITVYFADGNNRGWAGIFGGTRKIYDLIIDSYIVQS